MEYKQIVERLSLLRTKKNLTAHEVGLMLGNSDTYFYKVENGEITLNIPKFLEILEILEIDTEHFFYNDFENYERDKQIIKITKNLSKEELDALILLLKRKK